MTDHNYVPMEGDRVLVVDPALVTAGGASATVIGPSHVSPGAFLVRIDGKAGDWATTPRRLTLLCRPAPPRPEVESFIRSDKAVIEWAGGQEIGWYTTGGLSWTVKDMRAYSRMYSEAADQLQWDEMNAATS